MWKPDKLTKFECQECDAEFIVSEYVLEKRGMNVNEGCKCPYCWSIHTNAIVGTDDEMVQETYDALGCLGISHEEGKQCGLEHKEKEWAAEEILKREG